MARTSMTSLIAKVRGMIGDQGIDSVFSDDEIQEALDQHRRYYRYASLEPEESIAPGGAVTYHDFVSQDGGNWEDDVVLTDSSFGTVVADSPDLSLGRWTFTDPVSTGVMMVSGKRYDLAAAAADLCEQWMAKVKLEFHFARGGRSYHREQQLAGLEKLRDTYRKRQWITTGVQVRNDMW